MAEGFAVEPHYVSGYGDLIETERSNIGDVDHHVQFFARAAHYHFKGLLSPLKDPVNVYADSVIARLGSRSWRAEHTAIELHRVAWEYLGLEEEHTRNFGHNRSDPDEDAVTYSSSSPELPNLEIPDMYVSEALWETQTAITAIDWFANELLGWSPYNELIEKIFGNWNALDVAGDALINAGNGAEAVATSMMDGLDILDEHWDGGAAQNCVDYVTKVANALGEEGPLNRTVGKLYKLVAKEVNQAIEALVRDLNVPTKDIKGELGITGVCMIKQPSEEQLRRAKEALNNFRSLFEHAKNVINAVENVVEKAEGFLKSVESMSDVSNLDKTIQDLTSRIAPWTKEGEADLATALDLADLADTSEFEDAPTNDYKAGDDPERDGD